MADETKLMVWIDQDLCTGDGICEEIAPDVFHGRDDGLWVVKEEASVFGKSILFDAGDGDGHGPDGARGVTDVNVARNQDGRRLEAQCPGECIMIEPYDATIMADRGA